MFDPYHKWLGIPEGQRPPTHYQLLGVDPDEDDPEVIEEMAVRQAAHVRTYQTGPHAAECTRLLNEIARARRVLLDPALRREHDAGLGRPAPRRVPVAVGVVPPPGWTGFRDEGPGEIVPAAYRWRLRTRARRHSRALLLAVAVLVLTAATALWGIGAGVSGLGTGTPRTTAASPSATTPARPAR
jgi:hypothetical protein